MSDRRRTSARPTRPGQATRTALVSARIRLAPAGLLAAAVAASSAAGCGGSSGDAKAPAPPGATLSCPAPIGAVPKEDCAEIADDFGALSVSGSLQIAGSGKEASLRIEAIRAAGALANSLKEQRVALCEQYGKCQVKVADHDAKDKVLASAMRQLIDLWNKRRFSRTEEIVKFREAVRAIDHSVNGDPGGSGPVAPVSPPKILKGDAALTPVEGAGLAFKASEGARIAEAKGAGVHEVLRSNPEAMPLSGGHRYRIKIIGTYTPAWPVFVQPGDELTLRLKYRAAKAAELLVALRSLEDPEATEGTTTFQLAAGDKGTKEAKLSADEQSSGFYVGVGVRGGAVELDDVEIVNKDKVVAAARAEDAVEPGVKTECSVIGTKAIAGSKSLSCTPGNGDRITIGKPEGHLEIALADTVRDLSTVRTASLRGGRSVDAALREDAQLVVRIVGSGTVTIERLEVTDLGQ